MELLGSAQPVPSAASRRVHFCPEGEGFSVVGSDLEACYEVRPPRTPSRRAGGSVTRRPSLPTRMSACMHARSVLARVRTVSGVVPEETRASAGG